MKGLQPIRRFPTTVRGPTVVLAVALFAAATPVIAQDSSSGETEHRNAATEMLRDTSSPDPDENPDATASSDKSEPLVSELEQLRVEWLQVE